MHVRPKTPCDTSLGWCMHVCLKTPCYTILGRCVHVCRKRSFDTGLGWCIYACLKTPYDTSLGWCMHVCLKRSCDTSLCWCMHVCLKTSCDLCVGYCMHVWSLSHHLSRNREGRWGTTDDFPTSFLHFTLFSTALWDFANSRPVHSLMLSSHLFLSLPCLPPFAVPVRDGFSQTLLTGGMTRPLQFASLYHGQVFVRSDCLLDLGNWLPRW